jgi:hypothetical protein
MKQLLAEEQERVAAINSVPPQPQPRSRLPPAALYPQSSGSGGSPAPAVTASPNSRDSDSRIILPPIVHQNSGHLPHLPPIHASRGDSSYPRLPPILDHPPSHPYGSPRIEDRHQGRNDERENIQSQNGGMISTKRARPSSGDRADSDEVLKVCTLPYSGRPFWYLLLNTSFPF